MEELFKEGPDNLLLVYFMDDCPQEWKYHGDIISPYVVMHILISTWKCFNITPMQDQSHIRVTFKGMCNLHLHVFSM